MKFKIPEILKPKFSKSDKMALLFATILLTVFFTIMHFILEYAPLVVVDDSNQGTHINSTNSP
jgi:hypothetical protein